MQGAGLSEFVHRGREEVVAAREQRWMLRADGVLKPAGGASEEPHRVCAVAVRLAGERQRVEDRCELRVLRSERVVADRERAHGQCPRAVVVAASAPDLREVAERQRDFAMPGAESPLECGKRVAQQLLALLESTGRGHDRAQHAEVGGDA